MKQPTNLELAELFRRVSAAYQVLGENRFKIIAYDKAADSIEHLTSEVKDLWDDNKLSDIPGVGQGIASYLDELFRTGKVKHFDDIMKRVPSAMFPLLLVPGIGPKKAYRLVKELNLGSEKTVVADLAKAAGDHRIAELEGFGDKSEEDILAAIAIFKKGQIKENRMPLPIADAIARQVIAHMKNHTAVETIDALGSLRRQVSTIGDIDLAVATDKPEQALDHFLKFPHQKMVERGPSGATILLHNGRQVDLRVQTPDKYGAMLQYFTGSKNHNIKLREFGLSKGLSLNEYGMKPVASGGKVKDATFNKKENRYEFATEEKFYEALGMAWIPPELREDKGEIAASRQGKLPKVVELKDIKGDLHMHTSFDLKSSHDLGANTLREHLDKAVELGYAYIGLSDHNPKISGQTAAQITGIMKKRYEFYTKEREAWATRTKKHVQIFVMCEVDILPDGRLALPDSAFDYVDGVIVSLHSSFTQERKTVTKRIVAALTHHPKVRIFGHPTGRLLGSREGVDADWKEVFAAARSHDVALEINSYPDRLDLPDSLVYDAIRSGVRFAIDTDAHATDHMELMRYGVSVARRGWATKDDVVNTMEYNEFKQWLKK